MSTWSARLYVIARSAALAAVVAQVWQAAGSFGLQLLAARLLGGPGLGAVSLCLGLIILATAVTSGLVGDSLTVLDRTRASIRGALIGWGLALAGVSGILVAAGLVATGFLDTSPGLAVGLATVLFVLEELVRRILTASMHFWRLVLLDTSALAVSLTLLAILASRSSLSVGSFFAALAAGQAAGIAVGLCLAPREERAWRSVRGAAFAEVVAFGGWRALQVAVNPSALTAMRMLVVTAAGTVALGALEAARIFVAPAMLVVQGLGSYLFASYARDRRLPLEALCRRASRAALWLSVGSLALGGLAAVLAPALGHLVTGSSIPLATPSVLGWAAYAAATASVQPFASLAAARGRQRAVLGIRMIDTTLGILLLGVGLAMGWLPTSLSPLALASSLAVAGLLLRRLLGGMTPLMAQGASSEASRRASLEELSKHRQNTLLKSGVRTQVRGIT